MKPIKSKKEKKMKEKTNKKLAFVLAGALCAAIAVPAVTALTDAVGKNFSGFNGVYGGQTFTAFAEDAVEEPTVTYTMQTKGMYSLNNDYLLLTTNIDDVTQYQEVGYTVSLNGGEGVDQGSEKYYDSITFKTDAEGGTRTDAMADIFADNVVTGMIVTEIEYSEANNYSITPYMITNDDVRQEGKTVTVGKVSVTLELPENFTVDGYVSDTVSGRKLVLPTEEQITNNTGKAFVGWYDYETGAEVTAATTVTRNMTIAPYFAFDTGLALQPCYGYDNATQPDYVGTYEGTTFTHWTEEDGETKVSMSDVFVSPAQVSYAGGQKGVVVESKEGYSFGVNDAFRVKTSAIVGVEANKAYPIHYKLTNYGDEKLDFHVYQITSQTDLESAFDLGDKVIEPGQSVEFDYTLTLTKENTNLMTIFIFNQAASGVKMKMDMTLDTSASGTAYSGVADVTVQVPDGMEALAKTRYQVGDRFIAPELSGSIPEVYGSLKGWYDIATGAALTEKTSVLGDMTIAPYFGVGSDTATQLVPATTTNNPVDSLKGFTSVAKGDLAVVNGFYGRHFTSDDTYSAGAAFRTKAAYTVVASSTYKIYYVVTNCGQDKVSFTLHNVNSGTTLAGFNYTVTDLAKNKSAVFAIEISGFSNGNLLPYFVMNSGGTGLDLHVAMAVEEVTQAVS